MIIRVSCKNALFKPNIVLTDEELIRDGKGGRHRQKEVFNRYAGRMLGVCNRYARTAADAEDILQDAFIKVFDKNFGKFEGSLKGG